MPNGQKRKHDVIMQGFTKSPWWAVIQATGMVKFEDGLWMGNQLRAQNSRSEVCTISRVQLWGVCTPKFLQGQIEF